MKFLIFILSCIYFVTLPISAETIQKNPPITQATQKHYLFFIESSQNFNEAGDRVGAVTELKEIVEAPADFDQTYYDQKALDQTAFDRFIQQKNKLRTFTHGVEGPSIKLTGKKVKVGCDEEGYETLGKTTGTLASNFDLNPHQRFNYLKLSQKEQTQLLQSLRKDLSNHSEPGAKHIQTLLKKGPPPPQDLPEVDANTLIVDVIQDRTENRKYAVITGQQNKKVKMSRKMDNEKITQYNLLAVLLSTDGKNWQKVLIKTNESCFACDNKNLSYSFTDFGDLRGKGFLTILISETGYESWSYTALEIKDGKVEEFSLGGGGC